jgi:hypothetical protein
MHSITCLLSGIKLNFQVIDKAFYTFKSNLKLHSLIINEFENENFIIK